MITYTNTFKQNGINAVPVTVETEISNGIGIHLVGLADNAVKESLLRTVTALQACGYRIPGKRIVINLAPADLRKTGAGYDLAIAVGILSASGQEPMPLLDKYVMAGELGLDGSLRNVPGWLQAVEMAKESGRGCILPYHCARLAANAVGNANDIIAVTHLREVIRVLNGEEKPEWLDMTDIEEMYPRDLSKNSLSTWDSIGHFAEKRALEIAAAGGHPLLLMGAPGSEKNLLAKALVDILPPMTEDEMLDVQRIYASSASKSIMPGQRPFRSPDISASMAAVLGGGSGDAILPGEVSLAHNGVLFLDHFAEMPKAKAEALRGPLEDKCVRISRLKSVTTFPSDFHLVIATEPCPCGYYGEANKCTCTVGQRAAYLSHLNGPVMDRITMQVWAHPWKKGDGASYDGSSVVAERVAKARAVQLERQGCLNDALSTTDTANVVCFDRKNGRELAEFAESLICKMDMSVRAYVRMLKIARTIADLDGCESITRAHLCEAASYRFLDRQI